MERSPSEIAWWRKRLSNGCFHASQFFFRIGYWFHVWHWTRTSMFFGKISRRLRKWEEGIYFG